MARYANGQPVRVTTTVKDLTGALINATTLTLTVAKPDGTQQVYATPTNDSTGTYHQDIPAGDLTLNGRYAYAWTSTGTGAGVAIGDFDVYDPFADELLPLQDAKRHLSSGTVTTWTGDDNELLDFIAAVTEVIEAKIGPCGRRTVVQRIADAPGCQLVLNQTPVLSVATVQSVWTGGPNWTGANLVVDTDAGIVMTQLGAIPFYYGPWDVTYTSGRTVIPERFRHAAKELLRHLWETQRGQMQAAVLVSGELFTTTTGQTFSIPYRVLELLADDMTPAI